MPTEGRRRVDARGEATRTALIEAAESLFAQGGVEAVSTRQIGAAIGSSNTNVVAYHFGGKDALILEVYRYRMPQIDRRRRTLLDAADAAGKASDLATLMRAFSLPLFEQTDNIGRHSYARFLVGLERSGMIETRQQVSAEFPETDRLTDRIREQLPVGLRPWFPNRLRLATGLICSALLQIDRDTEAAPQNACAVVRRCNRHGRCGHGRATARRNVKKRPQEGENEMSKRSRLMATAAALGLFAGGPALAQDRTVLPIPPAPFDGVIKPSVMDSQPGTNHDVRAPEGAPNVFMFMSDDVGFAMTSAFGGPVPTPNFERLARQGQRYNRFNTTGICSPSRAALLTGRNHHQTGTGYLSDLPTGYPGYTGRIGPQTATIAQILRLNGWSTAMFGKHHNLPPQDRTIASSMDSWPTGLGFEYFFGFNSGDVDQYSPVLYRGIQRVPMTEGKGKLLDERLADDLISYVHNQQAANPAKPFLVYLAPGSTHAPHQAPKSYIARFKGKFDMGWDQMRVETWRRQIAMGVIPPDTKLTPRPSQLPAWDSLNAKQKAFNARQMEVAAAQLVFQDEQVGRVLDELERMGEYDNTLFAFVLGDNGASGEAGPRGTLDELRTIAVQNERENWLLDSLDIQGGPNTYQNYSVAWAWAMTTPYPWVKQYASMLGGIRNGAILSWPGHMKHPGTVCAQFGHLNDIVPTILEATGIPAPTSVLGTKQVPMAGQSLLSSLDTCQPDKPRTQYFEITGKMGLYHDGWFLSGEDGRDAWKELGPGGADPQVTWTIYNLDKDFSQSTDLSAQQPAKLAELRALFDKAAAANNVYPIDHRFGAARSNPAAMAAMPKHYTYWGKDVSVPAAGGAPFLAMRPFTVEADLVLDSASASGVVLALASRFGGWSLYLDKGRPALFWSRSTDPQEQAHVLAAKALPKGASTLRMRMETKQPGAPAEVILTSGDQEYARLSLPNNLLFPAGNGETLDVGRDLGVTVTDYASPQGEIEGDIKQVRIDLD